MVVVVVSSLLPCFFFGVVWRLACWSCPGSTCMAYGLQRRHLQRVLPHGVRGSGGLGPRQPSHHRLALMQLDGMFGWA